MSRTKEVHQKTKIKLNSDIHHYDKRIESNLRRFKEQFDEKTADLIEKYYNQMILDSVSKATQDKHLTCLITLSRLLGKDWQQVTTEDIQKLVVAFMKQYSTSGQETNTTQDFKKILKIFMRWLKTGSRKKDPHVLDPQEIRNVRIVRVKDQLARESLVETKDLDMIIHACGGNIRDKALIAVHHEAGTRIGETLTLQLKHVIFDNDGAIIKVTGKTGARPVRLVSSTPYLTAWINAHPFRENPDSPLWINLSSNMHGEQLSYHGATRILKERAKLAGISKRMYFHLFRHSQITNTANYLTEAQQKKRYGWSNISKMPARYTHLVDADVDEAILKHYGISKSKEPEQLSLPKICAICKFPNAHDVQYCEQCTKPLDLETALEKDEERELQKDELVRIGQAVDNLIKNNEEEKQYYKDEIERLKQALDSLKN